MAVGGTRPPDAFCFTAVNQPVRRPGSTRCAIRGGLTCGIDSFAAVSLLGAMDVPTTPDAKTPWHVWVVGAVSLLWNAMGALDFTMTQLKNDAYLKPFTPEQLAYFASFPLWMVIAWGVGTWGSLVGSLLLLARRGAAYLVFLASFVGMILTFLHNYVLTDGLKVMKGGAGAIVFSAVIMLIGLLLLAYSRAMRGRGVLR